MEPMDDEIADALSYFRYDHLPPELQKVSKPFCELAHTIADGPQVPQTRIALHRLMESKDAAVRAATSA